MGFSVGKEGKIPDFHEQQPTSKEVGTSPSKAVQKTEIESGTTKGASGVEPGDVGGSEFMKLKEDMKLVENTSVKNGTVFTAHFYSDSAKDPTLLEAIKLVSDSHLKHALNQKPNSLT